MNKEQMNNEQKNRKVVYGVTTLLLLAFVGLTLWAVWKSTTLLQQDEPLIYENTKNLDELNKPFPEELDNGWDGKG